MSAFLISELLTKNEQQAAPKKDMSFLHTFGLQLSCSRNLRVLDACSTMNYPLGVRVKDWVLSTEVVF